MVEPLQRLHFLLSPFCLCNVVFAVCSMTVHKKKHNTGGDRAVLYRNRPSSEIIFFLISKECLAKKKTNKKMKISHRHSGELSDLSNVLLRHLPR